MLPADRTLWATELESSSAEKDRAVLVDTQVEPESAMCACC